jgi:Spy/CpxP family protein refolding chaperone
MSSGRKQLLLVALTLLPIGAGIVAGMVAARMPGHSKDNEAADVRTDGLSEQLGLSDEQAQQMRTIWESVREQVRTSYTDAEQLQHSRDEELVGLLNQEQKAKFEKISRTYSDKFAQLRKKRDQSFASAVEQTRNLLSEEQRQKYDEILRTHVRPDQLGQLGGPAEMMGSSSSAATVAATTTRPAG